MVGGQPADHLHVQATHVAQGGLRMLDEVGYPPVVTGSGHPWLHERRMALAKGLSPEDSGRLLGNRRTSRVRGGAEVGRAPFVEFYYSRYTNEVLHNRQDLVGAEIWVTCHQEDDCRIAPASTLDGMSLGVLRAAPPWNLSPHSLAVRAAVCQACARGQFTIPAGADAIEVFLRYVESQTNHRLPAHPAYLEARRILAAAANSSIGATMFDAAAARGDVAGRAPGIDSPSGGTGRRSPQEVGPGARGHDSESTLPPRRMAQSK